MKLSSSSSSQPHDWNGDCVAIGAYDDEPRFRAATKEACCSQACAQRCEDDSSGEQTFDRCVSDCSTKSDWSARARCGRDDGAPQSCKATEDALWCLVSETDRAQEGDDGLENVCSAWKPLLDPGTKCADRKAFASSPTPRPSMTCLKKAEVLRLFGEEPVNYVCPPRSQESCKVDYACDL